MGTSAIGLSAPWPTRRQVAIPLCCLRAASKSSSSRLDARSPPTGDGPTVSAAHAAAQTRSVSAPPSGLRVFSSWETKKLCVHCRFPMSPEHSWSAAGRRRDRRAGAGGGSSHCHPGIARPAYPVQNKSAPAASVGSPSWPPRSSSPPSYPSRPDFSPYICCPRPRGESRA